MRDPDCVGKEMLLYKFGSIRNVARAHVKGEIEPCLQRHVRDVCDVVDIAAAAEGLRLGQEITVDGPPLGETGPYVDAAGRHFDIKSVLLYMIPTGIGFVPPRPTVIFPLEMVFDARVNVWNIRAIEKDKTNYVDISGVGFKRHPKLWKLADSRDEFTDASEPS